MKLKLTLVAIMLIGICSAYGQKINQSDLPGFVSKDFNSRFPTAQDVQWVKKKSKKVEATFRFKNANYSTEYDSLGNMIETEKEIAIGLVPKPVMQALEKEYKGCSYTVAYDVHLPMNKEIYEIQIKYNTKSYEIKVGTSGEILKKKELKQED